MGLGLITCGEVEDVDSAGKWKVGIESHSQVLKDHDASRKNSGKEGSTARNHSKVCARKDAWELAEDVCNLKKESKDTFFTHVEAWVMLAPSSTKAEKRHFVIDSGASMHMLSKKDMGSGELDTLKISTSTTTVVTADGRTFSHWPFQDYHRVLSQLHPRQSLRRI